MIKRLFAAALLLLLTQSFDASASSPVDTNASPPAPSTPEAFVQRAIASKPGDSFVVLNNGLTVLIRQQGGSDIVSTQVFVRAGSLYEGKYLTAGISHYLEHVVSGGTTRSFTETEAKERLKRIGAETNAYTSYDRTVYYINTSANHWKDALDLLLSYVTESTLDPGEVEREKPVIQQEFKLGENNPSSVLWKLFMKTAYQVSPVRNPVIGYEEVFVKLDRDALLDYYTRRYQPENMVVVVAGGIDPGEVLQFIAEKTKGFERKANDAVVTPEEPPQMSPRRETKEVPMMRLTQAMIGFPSVNLHDKDLYALDVLSILLGEGETSRLYRRLKDKENKVLSVGASNWTPSFAEGQLMISLALAPKHWPEVLNSIEEEINRLKKDPVAPKELEKAKKSVIAQHIFGKETVAAQASSLASSYFDTGDPYFDEAYVDGIRRVTPECVRDVARRYLVMDRTSVALATPTNAGAKPAAAGPAEASPGRTATVEQHALSNGLKVLIKKDATLPRVTLQLYGVGGLQLEDARKAGLSAFTASLLTAGTKQRSKLDIARAIEDVGGEIDSTSENNTYHVAIKVLKEDVGLALDVLADIVKNAQFPPDEIEKWREDTLLAIQRIDERWQSEIMRLFKENYFRKSPYGHERLGTVESVQSFKREDILSLYHRMVNPHHSVLAVYGDLDSQKTLQAIRSRFGGWTAPAVALPALPDEAHPLQADSTVDKKSEKVSAALFIGTNGLDIKDPRRAVLGVLNAVLSGGSTPSGRLFEALRGGKEDLVYLVAAFPFYGRNAGFFGVITQTTMGNLDKVQSIVLAHLKRMADEPVPADELATAKDMILTMHRLGRENLSAQAQSAAVDEVLGLGWDYDERYMKLVEAVTSEEVQSLAKELFAHTLIVRTLPEHPVEVLAPPPPKSDIHVPN